MAHRRHLRPNVGFHGHIRQSVKRFRESADMAAESAAVWRARMRRRGPPPAREAVWRRRRLPDPTNDGRKWKVAAYKRVVCNQERVIMASEDAPRGCPAASKRGRVAAAEAAGSNKWWYEVKGGGLYKMKTQFFTSLLLQFITWGSTYIEQLFSESTHSTALVQGSGIAVDIHMYVESFVHNGVKSLL